MAKKIKTKGLAICLKSMGGCGTIVQVSETQFSHAHLKMSSRSIQPGSEVAFFWHEQDTDSFMVGEIKLIYDAPMTKRGKRQKRKGIIFEELNLVISREIIRGKNCRDFVTYEISDDNYL